MCGYEIQEFGTKLSGSDGGRQTEAGVREEMKSLYHRAGVAPAEPLVWLVSDSNIVEDRSLTYLNDLLSSGRVADLFSREETDAIAHAVSGQAQSEGVVGTRAALVEERREHAASLSIW